jgi:hypothetical protein
VVFTQINEIRRTGSVLRIFIGGIEMNGRFRTSIVILAMYCQDVIAAWAPRMS